MLGEYSPVPIFDEKSVVPESAPFYLYPNYIMVFYAFGFPASRKALPPNGATGQVQACLNMILWKDDPLPKPTDNQPRPVIDLRDYIGKIMAEELIVTNDCPWTINACNNIAYLELSGSYRLVLNDPEAPGMVRVFYRVFPKSEVFARSSSLFLGENQI